MNDNICKKPRPQSTFHHLLICDKILSSDFLRLLTVAMAQQEAQLPCSRGCRVFPSETQSSDSGPSLSLLVRSTHLPALVSLSRSSNMMYSLAFTPVLAAFSSSVCLGLNWVTSCKFPRLSRKDWSDRVKLLIISYLLSVLIVLWMMIIVSTN
jgi:hypothetical protein